MPSRASARLAEDRTRQSDQYTTYTTSKHPAFLHLYHAAQTNLPTQKTMHDGNGYCSPPTEHRWIVTPDIFEMTIFSHQSISCLKHPSRPLNRRTSRGEHDSASWTAPVGRVLLDQRSIEQTTEFVGASIRAV